MGSIVQDIQWVRSLRKELRDPKLSVQVASSIENIHNCVKGGTDLNGWKKVDWRGSVNGSSRSTGHVQEGKDTKSNFFGNRSTGSSGSAGSSGFTGSTGSAGSTHHSSGSGAGEGYRDFGLSGHNYSSSHSAFSHRFKSSSQNGMGRSVPAVDSAVSIPLANNKQSSSTSNCSMTGSDPVVRTHHSHSLANKYVSKFKKNSEKVEDTILNTIILGKLNKFSELNYDEIKEFITHIIDSGETDMIKCFMKLVFEKAASEEIFCPLYAKLLGQLSARYPILLTEMANLYSQYMEIFEEISEENAANYNEVCKRNVEKKYRRGYSQFLAELIKHDVIDIDVFMKTVNKIITQMEQNSKSKESMKLNEEYADCLMKIMKAIQHQREKDDKDVLIYADSDDESENEKIQNIRTMLKGDVFARITPLTIRNVEYMGITNKTRFTMLDIYESIQAF